MNIDFKATEEKCRVLNYAAMAREYHVTRTTVLNVITGKYRHMRSPTALAIIDRLRSMQLLVEKSDDHIDQAA